MTTILGKFLTRKALAAICAAALLSSGALLAQNPYPQDPSQQGAPQQGPPPQMLAPEQLDTLVAPIALYPDSLLSQVLVACTYPLEVVEAGQWLRQNGNLRGPDLLEAARQQNWDASVQALVVFPEVVTRLNQDIRWTTDIGNAFLAQQADVMNAVQRMRAKAEANGRLSSTPQQTVSNESQGNQRAIVIQPANPQVVYVPVYDPTYIWGPPVYGYYPPLYYPGVGVGFSFGHGISIGAFFGGGGGWGGWGWGPSWYNRTVVVNNYFFHRYRFNDYHGGAFRGDYRGTSAWSHDPGHRLGVPYSNRYLDSQYRAASSAQFRGQGQRFGTPAQAQPAAQPSFNRGAPNAGNRGNFGSNAQPSRPAQQQYTPQQNPAQQNAQPGVRFGGNRGFQQQSVPQNHSAFGGVQDGGRTRVQSDHGYSSMGPQRTQSQGSFRGNASPAPAAAPRSSSSGSHDAGGRRR